MNNNHMKSLCRKTSQKLDALSRLFAFLPFHRREILMQAFLNFNSRIAL